MSTTAIQFKKAVKFEAKGRVALIGPAGSGKSYTGLILAKLLAGEKRVAAVDTEHGSLSKYADLFDFDVIEPDSYSADSWLESLTAAETAGYGAFLTDSLSHYWMGRDGALEFVDNASKRFKDQMGGWKEFSPLERTMIDRMIASPCHIICTMRTKTEYVEEVNAQGKKIRKKVGLAPVQRQGLEFEFDLVAYMDDENTLITDKTRCSYYTKKTISSPKEKDFRPFAEWLNGEHREEPIKLPADSRPIDIGEHRSGTKEAQEYVLNRKLSQPPSSSGITLDDAFIERLPHANRQKLIVTVNSLITEHVPKAFSSEEGKALIDRAKARFEGRNIRELTDDEVRDLAKFLYSAISVNNKMAAEPSDEIPSDALVALWEEITDIASTVSVFGKLHEQLAALLGQDDAEKIYRIALKRQGVEKSNQFRGDKAKGAKPAVKELYEMLQVAKRQQSEGVSDEDIPR